MKKIVGTAAAALMTITGLAGCGGGDSGGGYCEDVKTAQDELGGLDGADFTADKFDALTTAVHNIADEAPDDIKGSWTLLADQFESLESILKSAGLTMDDFGGLVQGNTPDGFDASQLQALETKLQSFDSQGITTATDKIHDQVLADCDIELNKTGN